MISPNFNLKADYLIDSLAFILLLTLIISFANCTDDGVTPIDACIDANGVDTCDTSIILPHTEWEFYEGNPVLVPSTEDSAWDNELAYSPAVIRYKDTLRMYYAGSNFVPRFEGEVHIGYSWSLDGINWTRYGSSPVLSPRLGFWDYPHVAGSVVIADGDTLRMWYAGGNVTAEGTKVGYAVSVDGINWIRHAEPVMLPGETWSEGGVLPGGVLIEDGTMKMWFSGGIGPHGYPKANTRWSIGYATSQDGIHWTANDDPVLTHGSEAKFDYFSATNATVRKTETGYEMWYNGARDVYPVIQGQIGYATSPDGLTWTKYEHNPILKSPGEDHGTVIYNPRVIEDNGQLKMWFGVWNPGPTICYAICTN